MEDGIGGQSDSVGVGINLSLILAHARALSPFPSAPSAVGQLTSFFVHLEVNHDSGCCWKKR